MKKISVDMDGVLADVYCQFLKGHENEFGKRPRMDEIIGLPETVAFPNGRKYVNTPGFFIDAPVILNSRQILEKLNNHYEIYIVSAATEFPLSLTEKQSWLDQHFPFINWKQIVFCGSKEIIRADIMIDDHFKNLDHFPGETYLFTQPHNQLTDPGRHVRVNSWQEIEKLLLP